MRFGLDLPPFGPLSDARTLAELAREAEDAGWDGFFIWDHMLHEADLPIADPWIALTAIAMSTERIRFGPLVTPLPRRRPWKVAREAATLDRLSNGRLILGVGIGSNRWGREFSTFGESPDDKTHAAMLDEGLDILTGLWSGEPYAYEGQHYSIAEARFQPTPVQSPRIPIWVACMWPNKAPLRRAARWDGVYPIIDGSDFTPDQIREMLAYIRQYRTSDAPFDVTIAGYTGNKDPATVSALLQGYAEAGVTWWQEGFWWTDTPDLVRERIRQGPPKL